MKKGYASVVFSTLFVIIFSLSVAVLGIRSQLLNAQMYKAALLQSGIYNVTSDIAQQKVTDAVVSFQKQLLQELSTSSSVQRPTLTNAIVLTLSTFIDNQTSDFVQKSFNYLNVSTTLQQIAEKNIDRDINWLLGNQESSEVFSYIPSTQDLERISKPNFNQILPDQQAQTAQDLFVRFINESSVGNVVTDIYNIMFQLAEVKEKAIYARQFVQVSKTLALIGVFVSFIMLSLAAFFTSKNKKIQQTLLNIFYSGAVLTSVVLVYYLTVALLNLNTLGALDLSNTSLTFSQQLLLTQSINSAKLYIYQQIPLTVLTVGLVLLCSSGAALVIKKVITKQSLSK
jgi:hypothetical protein